MRQLAPDEIPAFIRSVRVPFLDPFGAGEVDEPWVARTAARIEPDRAWVVVDDDRFVANCCIYSMNVTVPSASGEANCPTLPMGGVSAVGVHPTHRRRGHLTAMMTAMLDDCRRRGEPLAGLIASESSIYGRFGFGSATDAVTATIDKRRAVMARPPALPPLRLLEPEEALEVLPGLFDRLRRGRPGQVDMHPTRWADLVADDHPGGRDGFSRPFFAVGDDGCALYRARERGGGEGDGEELSVLYLGGSSAEVEAGLWRFLFEVDLVERVVAPFRPVDDPLRWRLADPRQLRIDALGDRLHLRVLDMAAAFERRGYRGSDRVVIEVEPPAVDCGDDDAVLGRWVLEAGPEGASCRRARPAEGPDLRLGVAALGSLYLGGHPATLLASAGLVEESTRGALGAADRLLTSRPVPATAFGF